MLRSLLCCSCLALLFWSVLATSASAQDFWQGDDITTWDEDIDGPLPRWREGGTPADDPNQSLTPMAVKFSQYGMAPTSGLIASPPEYSPCDGVIFRYSSSSWASVVVDCVAALTGDPADDEIAYVVVGGATQQATATSQFIVAGADMTKVVFTVKGTDSIWLRDYGPHFVWQSGALTIADSHYYPSRPKDNFIPTRLAEDFYTMPAYPMGLYYSGGNFQPGPDRQGFITSLINQDNPGFGTAYLEELYNSYQGIDTLHIMPRLPGSVDGTGHIDMWMYLVDEDDVIISQFLPGSNATAIEITNNAVLYMQSLGFTVTRVPAWNQGNTHYTYTNAYRVNDRIFIPTYGEGNPDYLDDDAVALAAWQASAGVGVEIVPINCYSIIPAAGAIHCIVMQKPRYTNAVPAAHVIAPDGGELLATGQTTELAWVATDDVAVTSVDLRYSTDGGATFPHVIALAEPNDGFFDWTVPAETEADVVVSATAADVDLNAVVAVSETAFEICPDARTTYDFSTGAGVDKWAWGFDSPNWASLDGVRYPVTTAIDALVPGAYAALALSDATAGDADANRYIANKPTSTRESTHVFDFTLNEPVGSIRDIEILWEGYGDVCQQQEVYVWDDVAGNWSDGAGDVGENAYMANYAGNRDDLLIGHIRSDFGRYVGLDGVITVMVYSDRSGQENFHDYMSVSVIADGCQQDLGFGGPGSIVASLCGDITSPGSTGTYELSGAAPSAPVFLFVGDTNNPTLIKGGFLVPFPYLMVIEGLSTDGSGQASLSVPGGGGAPLTLFVQSVVPNGGVYEFSNALAVILGL